MQHLEAKTLKLRRLRLITAHTTARIGRRPRPQIALRVESAPRSMTTLGGWNVARDKWAEILETMSPDDEKSGCRREARRLGDADAGRSGLNMLTVDTLKNNLTIVKNIYSNL